MNTLEELKNLYDLEQTDISENLKLCDSETGAFGQGVLFGLRMAIAVVERDLEK
jgi:hypothetical protein